MRNNKLTWIVVPEADRSVRRLRISRRTVLIALAALIGLMAGCVGWLQWKKSSYDGTVAKLTHRLSDQMQSHRDEMSTKEDTIEKLQQEVIHLTKQAAEVQNKLANLQQLEQQVRAISGISAIHTSGEEPELPVQAAGAGGIYRAVTEEEILVLAEHTEASLDDLSVSLSHMSERLDTLIGELEHLEYLASITPSYWPVAGGKVTSGYGYRIDPFTHRSAFHSGLDINGSQGDDIYASAAGTVKETGSQSDLGNYIIIDHAPGVQTLYAHLSKILVKRGDHVDKGDRIGLMGSSGRSTGPHLHFEVLEYDTPVDPAPYILD